ncbi:phe13-bombesin receptor-like [Acipenser ruthenus]|uniref:phe13-bombesin receptor-like n=1 Tax=Acipenser ruthenus TaxID=7906 RepID=UPI002741F185|nr:phe13-bombesin receptor-like [Acipenser ruthenus]
MSSSKETSTTSSSAEPGDSSSAQNFSTLDSGPAQEAPVAQAVLCTVLSVYGTIIAVGLLGNVILIKVFFTVKSMQTAPNIFIASLAVGDLLLLLTCVPVDASRYFADTGLFGRAGCKIISFHPAGLMSRVAVSHFRYRAIVRPMDLQGSDAVLWTICKVGCIWMLSMLFAVPEAVFSDLYSFNVMGISSTFETCAPYPVSERALQEIHSLLCFLTFYLVPLAIISVYYILIARTLVRSACNMPGEEHPHIRKQVPPGNPLYTGPRSLCNHWPPSTRKRVHSGLSVFLTLLMQADGGQRVLINSLA